MRPTSGADWTSLKTAIASQPNIPLYTMRYGLPPLYRKLWETLTLPGLKTGDSFLLQPGMLVDRSYSPSTGVLRLQVSLGDGCCLYCEHSAQLGFRKTESRAYHGGNGRASSPSPYIPVLNDGALRRHLVIPRKEVPSMVPLLVVWCSSPAGSEVAVDWVRKDRR